MSTQYQPLIPKWFCKYRNNRGHLVIHPDGRLIFNGYIVIQNYYDIKEINYIPFFRIGDWVTIYTRDHEIHRFFGHNTKKIYKHIERNLH